MTPTYVKIAIRFKAYQKRQRDIWESFKLIQFYTPLIREGIKNGGLPSFEMEYLWSKEIKKLDIKNTSGALHSLDIKSNYRRTLLETVLVFEDYLTHIIEMIYLDFPNKLKSPGENTVHQEMLADILDSKDYKEILARTSIAKYALKDNAGIMNLHEFIKKSSSKIEVLELLIDKRITGMFYGNPLDIFIKDKAKLGFNDYFLTNDLDLLNHYKWIVGARNITAHNDGKIDRKFIREVDSTAPFNKTLILDEVFIKNSIRTLSLLAARVSKLTIKFHYGNEPQGVLARTLTKKL